MTRRPAFLAAALGTVLLLTAACGGGDEPAASSGSSTAAPVESVNFGYIGDWNGASLLAVADQEGIWAKHGLKVKASVFTTGPIQVQALGTGDLDFGYIGPGALWLPASGKAKLVAINTLGNADRVIAQPGITSVADLKGKKVGVPEGTSGDMILTLALQKAGLTNKDIQRVPLDATTMVSAFSSKQIDAAGFWYPAIATIKKQVPDLNELAKDADFSSTVTFPTAFVASNDVVAKKPETVKKVLAALREAMAFRAGSNAKAITDTAKLLQRPEADIAADAKNSSLIPVSELDADSKDGTINGWLTALNDYFVSSGKLPAQVDPKTYYTSDLFTSAAG
jgi:NitT/TauT family transport system substrate-binding protein